MIDVAVSQLTTPRWDLGQELERIVAAGFDAISLWRPKLSDPGLGNVAARLACAGVRVSSLQWTGGFTGGDGRSFAESVADGLEAIDAAALLGAPVLVVHSGCRGGHTLAHATRLLHDALDRLVPRARDTGVVLALRPIHPDTAPGCSFLDRLARAIDLVEDYGDPAVRLALDLWQFADDVCISDNLSRLAAVAALVQVADRQGLPAPDQDRLPAGRGTLPLEPLVAALVAHGYRGDLEFDPVGEAVESLGYDAVFQETRCLSDAWEAAWQTAGGPLARGLEPAHVQLRGLHSRPAAAGAGFFPLGSGSRSPHASNQTVSRGRG
ncbi:MAG: sugar phosphate isomerase/epimerase family protein [Planctomycetia bacterium]|jgi:sugar phosphate isomerase/epimerase